VRAERTKVVTDSSEQAASPRRAGPSKSGKWVWLWHVAWIVLVTTVASLLILRWHWKSQFRARVETFRAAGYPVTPRELDASYVHSESGENAADYVLTAGTYYVDLPAERTRVLNRLEDRSDERILPTEPLPSDVNAILVGHIQANAKALGLLHQVSGIRESRYPVDLSKSGSLSLSYLQEVRKAFLLLGLEAVMLAEQDDSKGACSSIEAALDVADTLRTEPLLISQMIRRGGLTRTVDVLERVVNRVSLTDVQLHRLQGRLCSSYDPSAAKRGLIGQVCLCLELFERPEYIDPSHFGKLPPTALLEAYSALGLAAREGGIFLDLAQRYVDTLQLPVVERCKAANEIRVQFNTLQRNCILLPALSGLKQAVSLDLSLFAAVETASTALAIERYRLVGEHLPDTLEDLAPDYLENVADDPYDGKPLRYKKFGADGFVVYSIGPDNTDDGGFKRSKSGQPQDIAFVVGDPEKKP
jgi:hypothetical protein